MTSKPFRPLLACETPEDLEILTRLGHFPMYASAKLDGIRAIVRGGVLVSRTMKPIPSAFAQKYFVRPEFEGLDGELLAKHQEGETIYHDTYSAVMTHGGSVPLVFNVFDWAPPADSLGSNMPYSLRLEGVQGLAQLVDSSLISVLEQRRVDTVEEILVAEQAALDAGHEGLIVRRCDGRYKQGRSTLKEGILVKVARSLTSEATVEGFEEMMHNDNEAETSALGFTKRASLQANLRPSGMLGALYVRDIKTNVGFKIGTGFDHALREHIWQNQSEFLGKIAKYKYKPYGTKDAPRQPSFLGWRDPMDM